jgi:hypothetical protein
MSESQDIARANLIITTLAVYQTDFWLDVADSLRGEGTTCVFLSFDDRSTDMIRARGFEVHGPGGVHRAKPLNEAEFRAALTKFGVEDPAYWLGHERVTFGLSDQNALRERFVNYLELADRVCAEQKARGTVAMVQEVGGFVCVIASYFAARRHGIDNWFIEPSFFRGRLFFTRNTFSAPEPRTGVAAASEEVRGYLQRTLAGRHIVVPLKDKHHYSAVTRKIFNRRNSLRLVQKIIDKHLLGKHQEFGHIGHHVRTHLRMLASSLRLRSHYSQLADLGRFVYFPFHVPADMALTIRAPAYLDQLALIDQLARQLPAGVQLAVKEHPAMIGAMDARRLIGILGANPNLVLLNPSCNNYDVLGRAELVVSVNSKSGAEALLAGTPVIALGDSFYRTSGLVHLADSPAIASATISRLLANAKEVPDLPSTEAFFQRVWESSYPGELFVASPDNARLFSHSLQAALAGAR